MLSKTVYRLVPESQTLSAMKARCAALSALNQETSMAALVRAYDSPELAAFCCPLLWATRASTTADNSLVRETILLPINGVGVGDIVELERSWTDSDDELQWERMSRHLLVQGGFFMWTRSAHVAEQRMVLINMHHKAFADVIVQSRRLHDPEHAADTPLCSVPAEQAKSLEPS
jgi:hypothetical protein